MCFSAAASFTGGAVLTLIGAATIHKNREPSQRLFAAIPIVFGVQQISEGFVWLTLQSPGHDAMLKIFTYLFLTAAVVVWPTIVPLSVLLMEKSKQRRRLLYAFLAVGIALSAGYSAGMLLFSVTTRISGFHILYAIDSAPSIAGAASIAYLIATIPPLFITSTRRVYLFGSVIVLAYAVTYICFNEYLVSVWCFFAALTSIIIWWIISERKTRSDAGQFA